MLWNANGITKHKNELELILNSKNIDICLVSETHFTKQSHLQIPRYTVYHTIHPMNCARGGSAVIVRSNIKHHQGTDISMNEFQVTSIVVEINGSQINIAALYSPPRHVIKSDQYKHLFMQLGDRFILGGDFNAKHTRWGSRLITPKGKELLKASNELNCSFMSTNKPTYWPTDPLKIPDLIDFFVIRKVSPNFMKIDEGLDMSSDHSPIYLALSSRITQKDPPVSLYNRHTDWEYFRHLLTAATNATPTTADEIEDFSLHLTQSIQNAAWKSTPTNVKTAAKSFPREIKTMIVEKRKLRRRWQRSRDPQIKTLLNNATKQLSTAIKQVENDSLNKYLSRLSNEKSSNYSKWAPTTKRTHTNKFQ